MPDGEEADQVPASALQTTIALIALNKFQPTKICFFDDQVRADNLRSFSCVQPYVSALAAAAELQREPGLARSG